MKICSPEFYEMFECIASECPDTCCRHWQVVLDEEFIAKSKNLNLSDDSGSILKRKVKGLGKNKHLVNCENGDCPFLNSNLLCNLHTEVGNENLPETCRRYPRFINNFGAYEERGISFSCPEGARLMKEKGIVLDVFDDENVPMNYTDVDAELFFFVRGARNQIFDFLSSDKSDVDVKLNSIIRFSEKVQNSIDKRQYVNIEIDCSDNSKSEYLNNGLALKKAVALHCNNIFLNKEFLIKLCNSQIKEILDNEAFCLWTKYFIFKHLIMSAYDRKFLARAKAAVVSYFVISSLGGNIYDNMQLYSKETEHNEKNMLRLLKFAEKAEI